MSDKVTCPVCGNVLDAGAKFCGKCGTRLLQPPAAVPAEPSHTVTCPVCGNVLDAGARFCGKCGTRLSGAQGQTTPVAAIPTAKAAAGFSVAQPTNAPVAMAASAPTAGQVQTAMQATPQQTPGDGQAAAESSFYLVDFCKRVARKGNIPELIYLVLNILIITSVVWMVFGGGGMQAWQAFLIGIALYAVSLVIALSPVGEWILRKQAGCHEIKEAGQREFIEPIFQEVYAQARQADPSISDDVTLFINDDSAPNAFATGRKTVCVTEGLLHLPVGEIKATLGHEFGHLAHKDTDLTLVVIVGNMIVNALIVIIRLAIDLVHIVLGVVALIFGGTEGVLASLFNSLYHLLLSAIVVGLSKVWTWVGVMLMMKSSRSMEFDADAFSFSLGYGNELCAMLDSLGDSEVEGVFAMLARSHPPTSDRIAALQRLGATYKRSYANA